MLEDTLNYLNLLTFVIEGVVTSVSYKRIGVFQKITVKHQLRDGDSSWDL